MRKMNPREAKRLMQQMGLKVDELTDAQQVVIKTSSKDIVINNPKVSVIDIKGEKMFQIMGELVEKSTEKKLGISDEDAQIVAQQSNVGLEEARKALEQTEGDLAQAILLLSQRR
ncbi:MAG TPA: nascent polypeptide-associated complex protein [archaeon]|nr:nascent polypeptide-associated complex protein [archaeon]